MAGVVQPLASGEALAAYHARLTGSHDFRIYVDVLTLNEVQIGSAGLLDGQVNIAPGELIRRTCTLTLSDPDGALDFADASTWSGDSVWVDRLLRVRHVVEVPGHGEVTAVPFIGVPTSLSRQGIEVQVQCSDKGALASRGAAPYVVSKGTLATTAIKNIMSKLTGEFRFRIPSSTRRLAASYSVSYADDVSPLAVAKKIAKAELGRELDYSCDGFLTLRATPKTPVIDLGRVTEPMSGSADFSTAVNYVRVSGSGVVTTQTAAPSSPLSSTRLARQGVSRLLPLVIEESSYTKTSQTQARAATELSAGSRVSGEVTASVVPVFHLDADDPVGVESETGEATTLTFSQASIPLGVGGDMSIGFTRWVSSTSLNKPRTSRTRSARTSRRRR